VQLAPTIQRSSNAARSFEELYAIARCWPKNPLVVVRRSRRPDDGAGV
jgi:hypothetical protein